MKIMKHVISSFIFLIIFSDKIYTKKQHDPMVFLGGWKKK